jgi:hypothetical protein
MTSAAELAVDLPKPASLKIDRILSDAAGLETFFRIRLGAIVTNELAIHWTQQLHGSKLWPETDETLVNLQNTFLQYANRPVDERFARVLARQLAARAKTLTRGPLLAYERPVKPEWVYLEVTGLKAALWRGEKSGVDLQLDALSGHPAGNLLHLKVPISWLSFLAYRIGFSRRVRYDDEPRLFVGLRFLGYLKPRLDSTEPDFEDWFIDKQCKKHNVQIIKLRTRFSYEKAECPFDFSHDCWSCTKDVASCPASYLRSQI